MRTRPTRRTLAAALAASVVAATPAAADTHVWLDSNGRFWPKGITIPNGETVVWHGLGVRDSLARVAAGPIAADLAAGVLDTTDVCGGNDALDPGYLNPYQQSFDGDSGLELSGPTRNAVPGVWALGPEGGSVSNIEIPSPEAELIVPGLTARIAAGEVPSCQVLEDAVADETPVPDDPSTPIDESVEYKLKTVYDQVRTQSGSVPPSDPNAPPVMTWLVADPSGGQHVLCRAFYARCDADDTDGNGDGDPTDLDGDGDLLEKDGLDGFPCDEIGADPAQPATIPAGTYLNGLLTSTYADPDVTGVVLRFNWKDLQHDDGGVITERWDHLDRELERAIAQGKLVTLDVRAGMFGTPAWIFDGYLAPDDPADDRPADYHAPWCSTAPCAFTSAHPSAGQVTPLELVDHYDETPPGDGCGDLVRIGSPGDQHYRDLYKDFIARLASHVASDARWFQAIAHVKVSGANLRTSEAELPHHCNDDYANTGDYQLTPKVTYASVTGDRVLDVFKTLTPSGARKLRECVCNPEVWWNSGYTPGQLYDYYAEVEQQIVTSFFGTKSIGYQIIQDGFPRADAAGGGFLGDHLYREVLVDSSVVPGIEVNEGFDDQVSCPVPDASVVEDLVLQTASYCAPDTTILPAAPHVSLAIEPIYAVAPGSDLAAYPSDDDTGSRYPKFDEQSQTVLDEAAAGRFIDPSGAGSDHAAGKLFVPQHSGLQALPQERVELGYALEATIDPCDQERARLDVTGLWWGWAADAVGGVVAAFPIPDGTPISALHDPDTAGCPNKWIIEESVEYGELAIPMIPAPPQLTGFQTTNDVRSPEHVESALFNLAYNTNAVFIELYEDSIWRIATTRGTGSGAAPLDADGLRLAHCDADDPLDPYDSFDYYCYSKNLYQWAAELHARRAAAGLAWESFFGFSYPALAPPYTGTYAHTFVNDTGAPQDLAYINPGNCDPLLVDTGPFGNQVPSALGAIRVQP